MPLLSCTEITVCMLTPHKKGSDTNNIPKKTDRFTDKMFCSVSLSPCSFAVGKTIKLFSCSFMSRESFQSHPPELFYQ